MILLIYGIMVVGGTYAYFALGGINNNTIIGTAATANLNLTIARVAPTTANNALVPLMDNALGNAISGNTSKGAKSACFDNNNNVSCEVYKITIQNTGTSTVKLNGTFILKAKDASSVYKNLKWEVLENATSRKTSYVSNNMMDTTLVSDLMLAANTTKDYYVAIWLSEVGEDQSPVDKGNYGAIVTFASENGKGLTSTIGEVPKTTLYDAMLMKENNSTTVESAITYINSKTAPNFSNNATTDEGIFKTVDGDGDAYYYRGAVNDNHVIFADFCWRIVRTTGTGGVKLIYDGAPNNGVCNNTGTASQLSSTSKFNSSVSSPSYLGYMYGNVYEASIKNMNSLSGNIVYGNDVTYSGGKYTLTTTMTSPVSSWSTDFTTIGSKYHYTCFSSSTSCSTVYYIHSIFKDTTSNTITPYYFTLTGGKRIADILDEMVTNPSNKNSSVAKTNLEKWYQENLRDYTSYLEDTVWCNDRSISSLGGWNKDTSNVSYSDGSSTNWLWFGTNGRLNTKNLSLACNRKSDDVDRFTVNKGNGNGKLLYPVGLITGDEIAYAGGVIWTTNTNYYLYTGQNIWSGSPSSFDTWYPYVSDVHVSGYFGHYHVTDSRGLRPSISLKPGIIISGGVGSSNDPFVVDN